MASLPKVAAAIGEQNIPVFFGVMGDGNLQLTTKLVHQHGLQYYAMRHEAGAAAAAAGYARTTGGVGLATVTYGPGLTNAVTALTAAARARLPLVLVVGEVPLQGGSSHIQYVDQKNLARLCGIGWELIQSEDEAAEGTRRAFRRALGERRPVLLRVPTALPAAAGGPAREQQSAPLGPAGGGLFTRNAAHPQGVKAAAQLLQNSRRPLILAGRGAVLAQAGPDLTALAQRIGALLTTTVHAKGLFAGHPFSVGVAGGFSTPLARKLFAQADCLIAFGASLKRLTMKAFDPAVKVIQWDADAGALGKFTPIHLGVAGDAALGAQQLLAQLAAVNYSNPGFHNATLAREIAHYRYQFEDRSKPGALDTRTVLLELEAALPPDRLVGTDLGYHLLWAPLLLSAPDPYSFFFAQDFGAVGLGLGNAFGAAAAHPQRLTTVIVGDGGLTMSLTELETIGRYRLPIVVAVLNDGAYGAEVRLGKRAGLPTDLAFFDNPELAPLAEAIGFQGLTIRSRADFPALRQALALRAAPDNVPVQPLLLDIKINGRIPLDVPGPLTFFEGH